MKYVAKSFKQKQSGKLLFFGEDGLETPFFDWVTASKEEDGPVTKKRQRSANNKARENQWKQDLIMPYNT